MPRKGNVIKREILPDVKYNSELVSKFINCVMKNGKKNLAQKIVYNAFDLINTKTKKEPLEVFTKAIENAKPHLAVKSRRIGGATYQVPVEVKTDKKLSLAIKWLIFYARNRQGKTMIEKLAAELIDASNNTGATVKKREDTYKMAEANKAFAHFKW